MTTLNFNDLPCDIKLMIFHINKNKERDEKIKNNYNNVIKNLKDINNIFYKDLILNDRGFLSPTFNYNNHFQFYFRIIRVINDSKIPFLKRK